MMQENIGVLGQGFPFLVKLVKAWKTEDQEARERATLRTASGSKPKGAMGSGESGESTGSNRRFWGGPGPDCPASHWYKRMAAHCSSRNGDIVAMLQSRKYISVRMCPEIFTDDTP